MSRHPHQHQGWYNQGDTVAGLYNPAGRCGETPGINLGRSDVIRNAQGFNHGCQRGHVEAWQKNELDMLGF